MLEVQRMEAAETRRSDEMERRMGQAASQREQDLGVMKKVVCRSQAATHLSSLKERALQQLSDAGVFTDSLQVAVESKFVPSLLAMVTSQMTTDRKDLGGLMGAMKTSSSSKIQAQVKALTAEKRRIKAVDEAEREAH